MKVFLLDLWLDLREKRLAPVAVLLLAGIIAVPIVLAKKTEAPPPPPQTATTASAAATPVIVGQPSESQLSSKLQTFSPRDPFAPTGSVAAATGTATTGSSTTSTTTSGTTGTGTTGSGTTGSGTTGSGGATTGTSPSTGTGTGTTGTGNTTGQTKTTLYTYTSDLRFGAAGDMKTFKDVKRLELIPTDKNPKLVFLGVTTTGKTAVFLVDSNIGVDSPEGRCRPSNDECTFLYLRPDKDHDQATLTDADGTVLHVRLIAINRVTVSSADGNTNSNSNSGNSNGNSNSNRSPAFTGSATSKDESVPGETPPGEPSQRSSFQQFFADGAE